MRRLALTLATLAASTALANLPPPPREVECHHDTDCTLTQWEGCCGTCCPIDAYSVSKAELERRKNVCAAVDCAARRCTSKAMCRRADNGAGEVAVCRLGRCAKMEREDRAAACDSDAECVVSTFACCPGCCGTQPRAMTRAQLKRAEDVCATKRCAPRPNCGAVRQCKQDSDCRIYYPGPGPNASCHHSPCGCCPGTEAVALPMSAPVPQTPAPAPQQGPTYGLSTGDTAGPAPRQGVNCEPCPSRRPARPACEAGRCVVRPMVHRR